MNTVTASEGQLVIKTEEKQFALPPENDPIDGAIAGWKDLGEQVVTWKGVTKKVGKVAVKIYLDALDPETGENLTAYQSFSASLHPKSTLTQFIKDITGEDVSNTAFNVLQTIGISANFLFEHSVSKSNGKKYANIKSVYVRKNQKQVAIPKDFVAFPEKKDDDGRPVRQVATQVAPVKAAGRVTEV